MAVSQTTVTGPIYLPNITKPSEAKVIFELSSWDREEGEAVFVTGPYVAALDAYGNFEVNLFTTTEGELQAIYNVSVVYLTVSGEYRIERIGSIALAGPGPYCLADLEFIDPLTTSSFDLLAECQAYNTAAAASAAIAVAHADSLGDLGLLDSVGVAEITNGVLVTEAIGLAASDNDTTWPSTAAVRDYVDTAIVNQSIQFNSRQALATSIDASEYSDGTILNVSENYYVIDSAVVIQDSALRDYGVAGVKAVGIPENAFFATSFSEQSDVTIRFHSSLDGVNYGTINEKRFQLDTSKEVASRDPSIIYYRDEWWVFVTNNSDGVWDCVVYKSPDLITWRRHQFTLGSSAVYSSTTPVSGGTEPADQLWAAEPFIEDNGTLYIVVSIRYGSDITDGSITVTHKRQFLSTCTDPDAVTFSTPTIIDFGADNVDSMIDGHIIKEGATYWLVCKDDLAKTTRVYSASSISGPYTLDQELSETNLSIEAATWLKYFKRDETTGAVETLYRILVDNNRTKFSATPSEQLIGAPYYYEASTIDGTYSALTRLKFDTSVRHFTVINLGRGFPPEAVRDVTRMAAIGRQINFEASLADVALTAGSQAIFPQEGYSYYVNGSISSTLTIYEGPAERFYLSVRANNEACGITVLGAEKIASQFSIGYGQGGSDGLIEIRRQSNGQYRPVGMVIGSPSVSATFTPDLIFSGGVTGLALTTALGRWHRVGPMIKYQINIVINTIGSATGDVTIDLIDLPNAHASSINTTTQIHYFTSATVAPQPFGVISGGTNIVNLYRDRTAANQLTMDQSHFANGTSIVINGEYEAA